MGFLTSLFGSETNIWTIGFALIIVIILIVAGVWLLKMLFNMSGTMARGRQRRLTIVDTMALDARHNLVIVRHDDTEHLLVLSGSTATLVQANISTQDATTIQDPLLTKSSTAAKAAAIAASSAAAAGAGISSMHNKDGATPPKPQSGLSRLLQRKPKGATKETVPVETPNASDPKVESLTPPEPKNEKTTNLEEASPKDTTAPNPISQLRPLIKDQPQKMGPSLRHTGLLVPISEMVTANRTGTTSANDDKNAPSDADSAMNEAKRVDSKAMESIEEGAVPSNDAGKAKRGKTKAKPTKKSS